MKAKSVQRKVFPTTWSTPDEQIVPTGVYYAYINYAAYYYDEDSEYGQVYLSFLIIAGPYRGKHPYKHYYLTSPGAYKHLKDEFGKFGVVAKDGDKLAEACDKMMGKWVKLSISYDARGFKSVYLSKPTAKGQGNASRN